MNKSIISIILFISTFCVGSTVWAGEIDPVDSLSPFFPACKSSPVTVAKKNKKSFPIAMYDTDNCEELCSAWVDKCDELVQVSADCHKDSAGAARIQGAAECSQLPRAEKTQCKKELAATITDINNQIKENKELAEAICAKDKVFYNCVMSCEDGG